MNSKSKNNLFNYTLLAIFFLIFREYFIEYNFGPGDDYALLYFNRTKSFEYWLSNIFTFQSANRLVSEFLYNIISKIIDINSNLIGILATILWLILYLLLIKTFKKFLPKDIYFYFKILIFFPLIATAIFASPIYSLSYFSVLIFWTLSLNSIIKYKDKKKIKYYFFYLLILTISFWTMEIILGLLIFNILIPSLVNKDKHKSTAYLISFYSLPIMCIGSVYLTHKFLIIPEMGNTIYGFDIGVKSILEGFYFFFSSSVELILLLTTSLKHFSWDLLYKVFIPLILIFFLKKDQIKNKKIMDENQKIFFLISFFTFLCCSSIFFISGFPSSTYGYFNKLQIAPFIPLCIIISFIIKKLLKNTIFIFLFVFLWISSFAIQVNNFTKTNNLRLKILNNIENEIKKTQDININLITYLPLYLDKNYNNESFFLNQTTIPNYLNLKGYRIKEYWLVNERIISNKNFMKDINIYNNINSLKNYDFYFFETIMDSKEFVFKKLENNQVINKLSELKKRQKKTNLILNERIRQYFIKLFKNHVRYKDNKQ